MTTLTESTMKLAAEILEPLNTEIERETARLVRAMEQVARRLTEEAARIRAEPERHIQPNLLSGVSTARDVDEIAARVHALREVRAHVQSTFRAHE